MAFDDLDFEDTLEDEEAPLPEESGNRAFLIIAGILGGIAVLALVCIAVYALVLRPQQLAAQEAQRATVEAQNAEVERVIALTSTAFGATEAAAAITPTPTNTLIPDTPTVTASPTAVLVQPTTPAPTVDPLTATVEFLLTQQAATQTALFADVTGTATSTQELPDTGFADDIGLPILFGAAALLLVVIFLARRLRSA